MAKVQAQVAGGDIKQIEATTVADVKSALGVPKHTATVNGEPEDDGYYLSDYEFVSLAESTKGA